MTEDKKSQVAQCHREYATLVDALPASISNGWIRQGRDGSDLNVTLLKSHLNYRENESRKFVSQYPAKVSSSSGHVEEWLTPGMPHQIDSSAYMKPSPSGDLLAIVRPKTKNSSTTYSLEIWTQESLLRTIDLSQAHGDVLLDDWFGCLNWSPCESYLTYVAKPKPTASSSGKTWWEKDPETVKVQTQEEREEATPQQSNQKAETTENESSKDSKQDTPAIGDRFNYKEDWGERFTDVAETRLFLASVDSGRVIEVPLPIAKSDKDSDNSLPEASQETLQPTVGQPCFSACDNWLFYTLWWPIPQRLGMIYCFHRPCSIYAVDTSGLLQELNSKPDGETKGNEKQSPAAPQYCLTPRFSNSRCPRPSPCGNYIAFLTNGSAQQVETHNSTTSLRLIEWRKWIDNGKPTLTQLEDELPLHARYAFDKNIAIASLDTQILCPLLPAPVEYKDTYVELTKQYNESSEKVTSDLVNRIVLGFPGLYTTSLPSRCWGSNSDQIFLTSDWGSKSCIVRVDIQGSSLKQLVVEDRVKGVLDTFLEENSLSMDSSSDGETSLKWNDSLLASSSVIDVHSSWILFTVSSPSIPPVAGILHVGKDQNVSSGSPYLCEPLLQEYEDKKRVPQFRDALSTVLRTRWTCLSITPTTSTNYTGGKNPFQAVLVLPGDGVSQRMKRAQLPLLVFPHGGPHGVIPASFSINLSFLVSLGFAILLVNYRGSTGFGEQCVRFLPGKCGSADVNDCMDALNHALKLSTEDLPSTEGTHKSQQPLFSESAVSVCGGSHGGFLGAHLTAQFPSRFRSAALRNPVVNIAGEATVTDIPDWCFVESGLPFDWQNGSSPNGKELGQMWDVSPIAHISNVACPTLIALGGKDRRVPWSQGREWYEALKRNRVTTHIQFYPEDCHDLGSPGTLADQFVSIARWLIEFGTENT